MVIKERVLEPRDKVVDVICDACGNSCKVYPYTDDAHVEFVYAELKLIGTYASEYDGEICLVHLCETCLGKMLHVFQIPREKVTFPGAVM